MRTNRSCLLPILVGALSTMGCDRDSGSNVAASASAAGSEAPLASASASASAAPAAPSVTPLPTEPAPTTLQVDLAAMQWKDLKTGKSVELVDTELDKCGLPGWHLPLPKGIVLAKTFPTKGAGCSAKNVPGPPGTQILVTIGGTPLPRADLKNIKATPFEASDGYIVENDVKGPPSFYPRVEREVAGEVTSCAITYVDYDTARAVYELCRRLDKR